MANYGACTTVAKGGVGESGASTMLRTMTSGPTSKMMVLRNVDTNLCGNTGAVAVLLVNGKPVDHGVITDKGATIQFEAAPGESVVAIVHTVPLFNDIVCVVPGELTVELQECDLVG